GSDCGAPHLPPADARDRYNLPLHELLHDDRADFAQTHPRKSAGGHRGKAGGEGIGARPSASNPRKETDALKTAAGTLKDVEDAQRKLLEDEQPLVELEAEYAAARQAAERAQLLTAAL